MATAMLVALTTGCGGKAGSAKSGKDITAEFTDANFLAAARTALGKEATDNICDTDDFASVASLDLSGKGIASLAGIERFTALTELDCSMNRLTVLPKLPSGLTRLNCSVNQLTSLPALPSGLTELDCYTNQLASLPKLPSGLKQLSCSNNKLVSLPSLPSGMTSLGCSDNGLTSLPALPSGMGELYCPDNQLTSLPALPSGMTRLICYGNQLTALPQLPSTLKFLDCSRNRLTDVALNSGEAWDRLDVRYNYMTDPAKVTGFSGTWDSGDYYYTPQQTNGSE